MMIKEKNLTNAEKKRIESLDKRIEKIQNKIAINRKEYNIISKRQSKPEKNEFSHSFFENA